ncbi:helix-turn-helix domain-containing protein [Streptomyces sp. x-45]|uniref:helix-turn-helix domain-containing protein n=1 Tax=Streptomyces sp. x-45 TaxID=2789281 RepID=UPI00398051CA
MVGGMKRRTPPRELACDPETWPEADLAEPGAAAIQDIARALAAAMSERKLSLRALAEASGVNRQAIADLLAGRSWPDVATVARLGTALGAPLFPRTVRKERNR